MGAFKVLTVISLLCGTVFSQQKGYIPPPPPTAPTGSYSGPNSNFVNSNNPLIGSPSAQVSSSYDSSVDSFSSPVFTSAPDDSQNFVASANFAPEDDFGSSSFSSENNFQSGSSGSSSFSQNVQPASDFGSSSFGSSGSFSSPVSGNSGNFASSGNSGNFASSGNSGNFAPSSGLDIRSNSFQQGNGFSGSSSSSSNTRNSAPAKGGVDFSQAERTADGRLCVIKYSEVESLAKDPLLECKHKNVEKCHYTYVTKFNSVQEEVCEENFEKLCQITFKQQAVKEVVKKCYRPQSKVCNGQGPEQCKTVYETSCTTKYIPKGNGQNVGDTKCEKLPIEICGAGCVTEEGPEECHDKEVETLIDVPEEGCDLNPQKTCRFVTKLVPSLKPVPQCTTIPQEVCNLKFTAPRKEKKPLKSEWCLDESGTIPDNDTYESSASQPVPSYAAPPQQPPAPVYGAPPPPPQKQPVPTYSAAPQQPIPSYYGVG